MAKKKPYCDNNWQEYKDAPDDFFIPHRYEEVMEWKVHGWSLPSTVCCIIRTTDLDTKKTKEYVYRKPSAATKKVNDLMLQGGVEFCIADHESIHHLFPESLYDYEDVQDFDDPLA